MSRFIDRHIGITPAQAETVAQNCGFPDGAALIAATVPSDIRSNAALNLPVALSEHEALARLKGIMSENKVQRSLIGQGYYGTLTPAVIQRNVLENPGWYTAYTPYQAEISQGRLEALLNFQTMVADLTGLPVSNASLLDEGTAAAEAVTLAMGQYAGTAKVVFVDENVFPQTIDVIRTRMEARGIHVAVGKWNSIALRKEDGVFAAVIQYPDQMGEIHDYEAFAKAAQSQGALVIAATDLLALTLLKPPGEWGADICVGNSQRFGVPLGFGGPHAAFMSVKDGLKRKIPGRLIGISKDAQGRPAYRLSLQTREQHIRRDKATSNICTAQVLLAVMASMYAVYHGPGGLTAIAQRVHDHARALVSHLIQGGVTVRSGPFFDTITITGEAAGTWHAKANEAGLNLALIDETTLRVSLDELTTAEEVGAILTALGVLFSPAVLADQITKGATLDQVIPAGLQRSSAFLRHSVFNRYHTESELLRYLSRLEKKDIALNHSMIPLGSCTMKLNATSEMIPLSWPEVGGLHPFAPAEQTLGYQKMFAELEAWLAEITGFARVSLQPNAGSQGEYAGMLALHRYQMAQGQGHRNICLIPVSAHGTNPATAVMVGWKVVPVACDNDGNIDIADLRAKVELHTADLAALMITYPSTHGVFEEGIREICALIHEHGGQVYMDGANMNAQVGLTSPGLIGADVCHLNLHKTFCIPHGGGGPGVGPIGVAAHLVPFLPGHALLDNKCGAVCAAPWGSASINVISWMYIAMTGPDGQKRATESAILNANYIANCLDSYFPVLYKGKNGTVAHECILDFRQFKKVSVEDVAKRLIDYGFHAPTMSWPVGGTLMVEPTESESRAELDRFCEAMIAIHGEIQAVESGGVNADDSVLHHAPHPADVLLTAEWNRPYTREQAAFPLPWVRDHKYWPPVGRVDNVAGDRLLVCTCPSVESYAS